MSPINTWLVFKFQSSSLTFSTLQSCPVFEILLLLSTTLFWSLQANHHNNMSKLLIFTLVSHTKTRKQNMSLNRSSMDPSSRCQRSCSTFSTLCLLKRVNCLWYPSPSLPLSLPRFPKHCVCIRSSRSLSSLWKSHSGRDVIAAGCLIHLLALSSPAAGLDGYPLFPW